MLKEKKSELFLKEKKRLIIVAFGTFFLFSLLIVQYFRIQILESDKWIAKAKAQHEFIVKEPCQRGLFYSNTSIKPGHPEKSQPFVFNLTKYHLFVDPIAIPEEFKEEIASQLEAFIDKEEIDALVELQKKNRSRKVATWIEKGCKDQILSWWVPFARKRKIPRNALYFVSDYQRCYPYGKLLGQVLHTIRDAKDEITGEALPTGGLEAYFNDYLKGKPGKRKLMRSPRNPLEIEKMVEPPQNGANIYLTINHTIQAIMEEELEKGVLSCGAKGGWAIMMDPHNGHILGMAQYPFFDPSSYKDYFNDEEKIEHAKVKTVTDAFELGSMMKPITVAICLKANEELKRQGKQPLFNPEDKIDVTRYIYPGRANKPLKDLVFYRYLNMPMALQKSSNVYMAQIVDRLVHTLGIAWYRNALAEFGFGQKTGIELPAEAVGSLPTPGKFHPNGALEWSLSTPYSLSIGYNILATSLQMLRAHAVFANGGYLVQPTLVKKILSGKQEVLLDHTVEVRKELFPKVLPDEVIKEVVKGMKFTTKTGGCAALAEIPGYTEAGKTGTAEKISNGVYMRIQNVASFVGFAPVKSARFILLVSMDEPAIRILEGGSRNQLGGRASAPVFREIARRTLEYLGVPYDDPYGFSSKDPRYVPEKADWVKELKELKCLYDQWNAR